MQQLPLRPLFRRFTWKWLALFAVLFAGLVWVLLTTVRPEAHIPYSTLVEQIRLGNVAQVQISETEIAGRFTDPIQWSSESNASTAGESAIFPAGGYSDFRVRLPRTQGPTALSALLEEYAVPVIPVKLPATGFITLLRYGFPLALLLSVGLWVARQFPYTQSRSSRRPV